jgi:hypothetical protein
MLIGWSDILGIPVILETSGVSKGGIFVSMTAYPNVFLRRDSPWRFA